MDVRQGSKYAMFLYQKGLIKVFCFFKTISVSSFKFHPLNREKRSQVNQSFITTLFYKTTKRVFKLLSFGYILLFWIYGKRTIKLDE